MNTALESGDQWMDHVDADDTLENILLISHRSFDISNKRKK
jgi:hypothetical protein